MRTLPLLLVALAATALGQSTKPEYPISTSRPSFSDTPSLVPIGHLQLESGLTSFRRGGDDPDRTDFGEALLRYGLSSRIELRLGLPNYNLQAGHAADGFDNTLLAASVYLGKLAGFDIGIIPTVAFPTGNPDLRYERVTPSFTLNAQHDLGGGSNIATTLGQTYERHVAQSLATLVVVRPLCGDLTGFVEYAGYFDPTARPEEYGHVGLQYLPTKTSQIDLHGGVGLTASTPHAFIGAGYSVRF